MPGCSRTTQGTPAIQRVGQVNPYVLHKTPRTALASDLLYSDVLLAQVRHGIHSLDVIWACMRRGRENNSHKLQNNKGISWHTANVRLYGG